MNTNERHINPQVKSILENHNGECVIDELLKENKYIITKLTDLKKYLTGKEILKYLSATEKFDLKIANGRIADGKSESNNYIVINKDEPYIGEIIEILKQNGHWDYKKCCMCGKELSACDFETYEYEFDNEGNYWCLSCFEEEGDGGNLLG